MYVYVDYLSHSLIVVSSPFFNFLSNNNNLISMIKKCASVKIIYIGLQICATYDGLNRLNSEMLLEEKSNFTQFPLPPSPPHFCILGYLEFLLIMRETRSTKQVP